MSRLLRVGRLSQIEMYRRWRAAAIYREIDRRGRLHSLDQPHRLHWISDRLSLDRGQQVAVLQAELLED